MDAWAIRTDQRYHGRPTRTRSTRGARLAPRRSGGRQLSLPLSRPSSGECSNRHCAELASTTRDGDEPTAVVQQNLAQRLVPYRSTRTAVASTGGIVPDALAASPAVKRAW